MNQNNNDNNYTSIPKKQYSQNSNMYNNLNDNMLNINQTEGTVNNYQSNNNGSSNITNINSNNQILQNSNTYSTQNSNMYNNLNNNMFNITTSESIINNYQQNNNIDSKLTNVNSNNQIQSNNNTLNKNQNMYATDSIKGNESAVINQYQINNIDSNDNYISEKNTSTTDNNSNEKYISKKGKVLMFIVMFCAFFIFFDNFITSMDWYSDLHTQALIQRDEKLNLALQTFENLITIINWFIVLIITIVSFIFRKKDKKQQNSVSIYEWYMCAGVLHIIVGTIGLTPIIYSVATLVFTLKNKKIKKEKKLKVKSDNILITMSIINIILIAFMFYAMQTNLFDEIEENIKDYKENKEVIVEDNDTEHIVTTFDKVVEKFGNNVTENKKYKIENVKLSNVTASLYIYYSYELINNKPKTIISFKHGEDVLYTHTDQYNQFNLTYLNILNNNIIYGISYCDNVDNGICDNHLTYSQVIAFNRKNTHTFYDYTIISQYGNSYAYYARSLFLEDESVYASPYNDFRVYDIEIKNDNLYIYTIVENYEDIFNSDYNKYKKNCENPYWITSTFDMQRVFQTKFIYNETYNEYEIDELTKVSSIKYEKYCNNKNIIDLNN